MKQKLKKLLKGSFFSIFAGVLLVTGIIYAWTEPTVAPPDSNAAAPINVSSVSQYKDGALGIGGVFRGYSVAIFDGNVGIGTMAPTAKLEVVCPSGFTNVKAGGNQLGCMETAVHDGGAYVDWMTANNVCFTTYGGRLPIWSEWYIASANFALSHLLHPHITMNG